MKQWAKSSRWRAARDKAWHYGSFRQWARIMRLTGGNPFRPYEQRGYVSEDFLLQTMWMMRFDKLAEKRPFPMGAGATTVRFSHE